MAFLILPGVSNSVWGGQPGFDRILDLHGIVDVPIGLRDETVECFDVFLVSIFPSSADPSNPACADAYNRISR